MIKINLLGVAPSPAKMPSGGGPPATIVTQAVMFLGAVIICFGVVGVFYKIWTSQQDRLAEALRKEKIRQTDLAAVQSQNAHYLQLIHDLQTREDTIDALQAAQSGPVEMMTVLGDVVNKTTDVYLYSMSPVGDRFELKGQSGSVNSMADFLADLKNSGSFTDVQLEDFYEDDVQEQVTYKFTVNCQFNPSAKATPQAAGGPSPGGPGTGHSGRPAGPQGGSSQPPGQRRSL